MEKIKVRRENPPTLPVDAVIKVATFISDAKVLFSLLGALRPLNLLGPLEHLWELGLVKPYSSLWPSLTISHEDKALSGESFDRIYAIAKLYKQVHFNDAHSVKIHVDQFHRDTEWHLSSVGLSLWSGWTNLRITHLEVRLRSNQIEETHATLMEALPKLPHLKYLKAICTGSSPIEGTALIDSILAFAANSANLSGLSLQLSGFHPFPISDASANNLLRWFERQTIQVLKFSHWYVDIQNVALREAFYEAIFNSPSLTKVSCRQSCLNDMDFASLKFLTRSLKFDGFAFHPLDLATFVNAFIGSSVQRVSLTNISPDQPEAILRLLEVLKKTSIRELKLSGFHVDQIAWREWIRYLRLSSLETLILKHVGMTNARAQDLGRAIKYNDTIQTLDVSFNRIGFGGVKDLIISATDSRRPVRMKCLRFNNCGIASDDMETLKLFAARRRISSTEWSKK